MIDYYRVAFDQYERETAAAREVIRRAQARLRDEIARAPELEADPRFGSGADPTEPNDAKFAVDAAIEQPEQVTGPSVSEPAPASRSAAASSPPGDGSPAITRGARADRGRPAGGPRTNGEPASDPVASPPRSPKEPGTGGRTEQPGSARSDKGTGPVGTPTPASLRCGEPGCPYETTRPQNLGIHRAKAHGISGRTKTQSAVKAPSPRPGLVRSNGKDRREISEDCPRGCGRHFRWEPSLLSHVRSCDGRPWAEQGGGPR